MYTGLNYYTKRLEFSGQERASSETEKVRMRQEKDSSPHPVDFEKTDKLTKELTLHNLLVIFAFSDWKT